MTTVFIIRPARPDDLAALPLIERAATAQFRATPYAYLADDDLVSAEVDLAQEYVWVAGISRSALRSCICSLSQYICTSLMSIQIMRARV